MPTYQSPGVYKEEKFPSPAAELLTAVPAFLGYTVQVPQNDRGVKRFYEPRRLTIWPQFEEFFGRSPTGGYLADAVRGFFENSGRFCYVLPLNDDDSFGEALEKGLKKLKHLDAIDLVCAPDLMLNIPRVPELQQKLLDHCDEAANRFGILDSPPGQKADGVLAHRRRLKGINGALYYPWIQIQDMGFVPPCGHIAGIYARSDGINGVHKAPANEVLEGVVDLEFGLTKAEQDRLNPTGVNCLRAFPGRGIRVWGARTLSHDPAWNYINVRRIFLTAGRWIERNLTDIVFEPNDSRLWSQIDRELTAYFSGLYQQGALKGHTPEEAFYVKCDAETNPSEIREAGMVVTEIGLAPASPSEFVIVRIIHGVGGVTLVGPARPL